MYLELSKCNNNKMGKRTTDWETYFTKTAMHVLDQLNMHFAKKNNFLVISVLYLLYTSTTRKLPGEPLVSCKIANATAFCGYSLSIAGDNDER